MRGPMWNPIRSAISSFHSANFRKPEERLFLIRASPSETIVRFSPTSGIMSATVQSAAKSTYSAIFDSYSEGGKTFDATAESSLNATPAHAKWWNG